MKPKLEKADRLRRVRQVIEEDPFITDKELASLFGVSIQTVRLDRLELGIPESRERTRRLAEEATNKVRTVETEVALTGTERVKYLRPVKAGERLVAKAEVLTRSGRRHVGKVTTKAGHEEVFIGEFTVFAVEEHESSSQDSRRCSD